MSEKYATGPRTIRFGQLTKPLGRDYLKNVRILFLVKKVYFAVFIQYYNTKFNKYVNIKHLWNTRK